MAAIVLALRSSIPLPSLALRARASSGAVRALPFASSDAVRVHVRPPAPYVPRRGVATTREAGGGGERGENTGGGGGGPRGSRGQAGGSGAGIYFFSGLTLLTFGLGVWQAVRYQGKVELLAKRKEALDRPPVDISAAGSSHHHLLPDFQRVSVRGVLDTSPSSIMTVSPRPPPKGMPPSLSSAANAGYLVVQPLIRPDGSRLLVLRGWTPADVALAEVEGGMEEKDGGGKGKKKTREVVVEVTGVIRRSEEPGTFGPSSNVGHGVGSRRRPSSAASHDDDGGAAAAASAAAVAAGRSFLYIDVDAMAKAAGFDAQKGDQPLLVEALTVTRVNEEKGGKKGGPSPSSPATPPAAPPAPVSPFPYPREPSTLYETHVMPMTHLIYSGTWFTLALAGVFLVRARFRKGGSRGSRVRGGMA